MVVVSTGVERDEGEVRGAGRGRIRGGVPRETVSPVATFGIVAILAYLLGCAWLYHRMTRIPKDSWSGFACRSSRRKH